MLIPASLVLALAASAGTASADGNRDAAAVVKALGTVEPEEVVDVGAKVAGVVQRLGADPRDASKAIDFNTAVKAGTVLVQLDPAPYQAAAAQARADVRRAEAGLRLATAKVTLAERELERAKRRAADKTADASEVEVAQAAVEVARAGVAVEEAAVAQGKAALQRAELNLNDCTIRSPIDGVVIDRRVSVGQAVAFGVNAPSLFLIAKDLKRLQVWTSVKEADIGRVAKGQPARFTVDAYPNATFQGRVAQVRLNATMTKGAVTYTVVVDVDNSDGKLLPYLTAQVSIEGGER
jgi:HlyD family secretion protein